VWGDKTGTTSPGPTQSSDFTPPFSEPIPSSFLSRLFVGECDECDEYWSAFELSLIPLDSCQHPRVYGEDKIGEMVRDSVGSSEAPCIPFVYSLWDVVNTIRISESVQFPRFAARLSGVGGDKTGTTSPGRDSIRNLQRHFSEPTRSLFFRLFVGECDECDEYCSAFGLSLIPLDSCQHPWVYGEDKIGEMVRGSAGPSEPLACLLFTRCGIW
jgi:hypothetical protein